MYRGFQDVWLVAPEGHGAGDGQHRVQAPEQDAVQQQLADTRRQRERRQVAPQQRQPLAARVECANVLSNTTAAGVKRGSQAQESWENSDVRKPAFTAAAKAHSGT